MPLLPSCPTNFEFPSDNWNSTKGFFCGLCWKPERPSARRAGFPIWSWTGWSSPVKWGFHSNWWPFIRVDNSAEVGVELVDQRILDLETFYQLQGTLDSALVSTNFIHISAWTSLLRILRRQSWRNPGEYEAKIKLEDGGFIYWSFKSTTKIPFLPNQLATGIHLTYQASVYGRSSFTPVGPALLFVSQVGAITERIGFGWVHQLQYEEYDKKGELIDRGECVEYHPENPPPLRFVKSWQKIRLG